MMPPRMEILPEKKFVGRRMGMSLSDNRTHQLWKSFMPRRKEIRNNIGAELYSIEVYRPGFFDRFDAGATFVKWAAVEVSDFSAVPEGMEIMTSPPGFYAVFIHKGPASAGPKTYQHIFGNWLPASNYRVDDRPHFAIMGDKYKNEDPDSEEEIWVPVKIKSE